MSTGFDLSTMQSLISQSSLLDYGHRNMYVQTYLKSNNLSNTSSATSATASKASTTPTYTLTKTSSPTNTFLDGTKDMVSALKKASDALSGVSSKGITSTSTAVSGTASKDATDQSYTVNVQQLAAKQKNIGSTMGSYGQSIDPSQQTLSFAVGDGDNKKTTDITVDLTGSKSDLESQQRMADAINKKGIGVTAEVVKDSSTKSHITFTSNNTGTDNAFTVSQNSSQGNFLTATNAGATQAQNQAQNASYTVDGDLRFSQSNTVSLQDGKVKLNLQTADKKDATVKVGANADDAAKKISNFVDQYNVLMGTGNANRSDYAFAGALADRMHDAVSKNYYALKEIGVTFDSSGQMTVDSDKLTKAMKDTPDKVTKMFGEDGALTKSASKEAAGLTSLAKSLSTSQYSYQYTPPTAVAKATSTSSFFNTFM